MKIKVSFFCIVMVFALVITHSYLSLAALVAAAVHELGHIVAAKLCGIELKEMKLDIFGAALTPQKALCSYKSEMILASGGPLINIVSSLFLFLFFDVLGENVRLFAVASLFLGVLNLLPVQDFDGGRILYCAMAQGISEDVALSMSKYISMITAFLLWLLSVYLLLKIGVSLSLFVFSFALLCRIFAQCKV